MEAYELFTEIGISFPKDFIFSKDDWKDFYITLSKFKHRALKRQGIDPLDITLPTGRIIKNRRSERGG